MFGFNSLSFINLTGLLMRRSVPFFVVIVFVSLCFTAFEWQKGKKGKTKSSTTVSFKKDIFPIIKKNCLPCHTEDQMNPSELYLETCADLMKGGKHGIPIIPGKADSSMLIKKLLPPPPFGDPMPLKRKTPLSADTVEVIKKWINQGAKDN